MKIKALAPWFGGKRNLAPDIIAEFGDHRAYWEPFCGSMAVLMAKEPCRMETVNDMLGDDAGLRYMTIAFETKTGYMKDWALTYLAHHAEQKPCN